MAGGEILDEYSTHEDDFSCLPKKGTKERKEFDKEVERLCDLVDSQMDGDDFIGHRG